MPETPQEVLKMIQDNNIKIIDLKFIDMPGIWQHCSFYYDQIDEMADKEMKEMNSSDYTNCRNLFNYLRFSKDFYYLKNFTYSPYKDRIFNEVDKRKHKAEFIIKCTFLEIYNEEIRDLLVEKEKPLKIRETLDGEVYVSGLETRIVASPVEIGKYMEEAAGRRVVAATAAKSMPE